MRRRSFLLGLIAAPAAAPVAAAVAKATEPDVATGLSAVNSVPSAWLNDALDSVVVRDQQIRNCLIMIQRANLTHWHGAPAGSLNRVAELAARSSTAPSDSPGGA